MDLSFFLQSLITVFAVVDPLGGAMLFLAMTAGNTPAERRAMAKRAAWVSLGVLLVFLAGGRAVLSLFSISLPAFQVAGGIVIGIMALDLLKATDTGVRATQREEDEGLHKADVSVTPIAVPMLAGPGAISAVVVLSSVGGAEHAKLILAIDIALVAVTIYAMLAAADRILDALGQTGVNVITRLIGLIVLAVAVQFVLTGISTFCK